MLALRRMNEADTGAYSCVPLCPPALPLQLTRWLCHGTEAPWTRGARERALILLLPRVAGHLPRVCVLDCVFRARLVGRVRCLTVTHMVYGDLTGSSRAQACAGVAAGDYRKVDRVWCGRSWVWHTWKSSASAAKNTGALSSQFRASECLVRYCVSVCVRF